MPDPLTFHHVQATCVASIVLLLFAAHYYIRDAQRALAAFLLLFAGVVAVKLVTLHANPATAGPLATATYWCTPILLWYGVVNPLGTRWAIRHELAKADPVFQAAVLVQRTLLRHATSRFWRPTLRVTYNQAIATRRVLLERLTDPSAGRAGGLVDPPPPRD